MHYSQSSPADRIGCMHRHIRERMHALTGLDDFTGIEIASLVRMVATQFETQEELPAESDTLSGPRWGLLLRLLAEEERGNADITPTYLSRCQNVSKNTISSLLRGLEEQGLIARQLGEDDRRFFRIALTPQGRALIHKTAPGRVEHMNRLVSHLTPEERAQLSGLLSKLFRSMIEQSKTKEVA